MVQVNLMLYLRGVFVLRRESKMEKVDVAIVKLGLGGEGISVNSCLEAGFVEILGEEIAQKLADTLQAAVIDAMKEADACVS